MSLPGSAQPVTRVFSSIAPKEQKFSLFADLVCERKFTVGYKTRTMLTYSPRRISEAAANHRRSLKNPPKKVDGYRDTLLKQGLTQTVGQLREWKVAI